MTRKRSSRSRRTVRLQSAERFLFILAATIYLVGLFGGIGLLDMPVSTAVILLAVGGGIEFIITLRLLF